jgi:xylulokinase
MTAEVLVIDIGTGAAKIECFDAEGTVLQRSVAEYTGINPQSDEIDPEIWYSAVGEAIRTLGGRVTLSALRYIVLSGQMQDVIPIRNGRAAAPAILYFGHRESTSFDSWLTTVGADHIRTVVCNTPDTAGFVAKLLYLQEKDPAVVDKIDYILCGAHDYIAYRLTGVAATDPTTASTTGLFSPTRGTWADEIVSTLGQWGEKLPPIRRGNEIDGVVLPEVASELGLPPTVQVVHGVGDVGASILAMEMEGFSRSLYLGTSGWIQDVGPLDQPGDATRGVFTLRHPVEDRLIRVAPVLTAAGAFEWFVNSVLNADDTERDGLFARLGAATSAMDAASTSVLFLPYLAGERSPFSDPDASGMFVGLRRETDYVSLFRAIEEGVAFSIRSIFETLFDGGTDARGSLIQVSGGGASIEGFPQLVADVLRTPITIAENARYSGTSALFGMVSNAPRRQTAQPAQTAKYNTVHPQHRDDRYAKKYDLFREAYQVNQKLMRALRTI